MPAPDREGKALGDVLLKAYVALGNRYVPGTRTIREIEAPDACDRPARNSPISDQRCQRVRGASRIL